MGTKTPKTEAQHRPLPLPGGGVLEPRNLPDEVAAEDAFIERNRSTINRALQEGI